MNTFYKIKDDNSYSIVNGRTGKIFATTTRSLKTVNGATETADEREARFIRQAKLIDKLNVLSN